MIEVYKTNVQNALQAEKILNILNKTFSDAKINFDLEDHDKILRVAGIKKADIQDIILGLNNLGFKCQVLD